MGTMISGCGGGGLAAVIALMADTAYSRGMRTRARASGTPVVSAAEQRQALALYRRIQESRAKLVGPDGRAHVLPESLSAFLAVLVEDLDGGQPVSLVQDDSPLTTVEAARMIGVSRQFLIGLLQRGDIPHHMVGTHRRVYARDLLAYKAKRDSARRRILDDLTRAEAEDGLYDLEPAGGRA